MTIRKVTKHVFETSAGKPFDDKASAAKHQARLDLAEFFNVPALDGGEGVADQIIDNLDAFAEIIRPLIKKPRGKASGEAQADDYEAAIAEAKPAKGKAA
jgi:hypothetical protein